MGYTQPSQVSTDAKDLLGELAKQVLRARAIRRSEDKAAEPVRRPRCYIAGPIAGVPDFRERFAAAVPIVEALGYDPVNPCEITPAAHDGDCPPGYDPGEEGEHTSSACFMRSDLRALLDCDAIYMLPGWRESRGATTEHTVAVACGIPVLEEGTTP